MDLKETGQLGALAERHWYYRSKARALGALLCPRRFRALLDVGAGSGFFSRWLLEQGVAGEAFCVDPGYRGEWQELHAGKPIHFLREAPAARADLLIMMDVLEHVEDDAALLRHWAQTVPAGTPIVITVPAFMALWSAHDEFLGHKRRYTRGSLEALVASAGLRIRRCHYYFGLVLPLAAATRIGARLRPRAAPRSQLRPHAPLVNALLEGLCRLELPFMTHNRLGGLSLFCECEER